MDTRVECKIRNRTDRICVLRMFLDNPARVIRSEALARIAVNYRQIIRQLRQEDGWDIISGHTILEMIEVGDFPDDESAFPGISTIGPDDYLLMDQKPDPDAPRRWALARKMRRATFNTGRS